MFLKVSAETMKSYTLEAELPQSAVGQLNTQINIHRTRVGQVGNHVNLIDFDMSVPLKSTLMNVYSFHEVKSWNDLLYMYFLEGP